METPLVESSAQSTAFHSHRGGVCRRARTDRRAAKSIETGFRRGAILLKRRHDGMILTRAHRGSSEKLDATLHGVRRICLRQHDESANDLPDGSKSTAIVGDAGVYPASIVESKEVIVTRDEHTTRAASEGQVILVRRPEKPSLSGGDDIDAAPAQTPSDCRTDMLVKVELRPRRHVVDSVAARRATDRRA